MNPSTRLEPIPGVQAVCRCCEQPAHCKARAKTWLVACVSTTWRLPCSSFLVLTCFLIGGCSILPKKEVRSLQVDFAVSQAVYAGFAGHARRGCATQPGPRPAALWKRSVVVDCSIPSITNLIIFQKCISTCVYIYLYHRNPMNPHN